MFGRIHAAAADEPWRDWIRHVSFILAAVLCEQNAIIPVPFLGAIIRWGKCRGLLGAIICSGVMAVSEHVAASSMPVPAWRSAPCSQRLCAGSEWVLGSAPGSIFAFLAAESQC